MQMKKPLKRTACIIAYSIFYTDNAQENHTQTTPQVLDGHFRLYVDEEYVKNAEFFMYFKDTASKRKIKLKFNQTFPDEVQTISGDLFLLPAEFVDESGNLHRVNVHIKAGANKNLKTIKKILL